MADGDQVIHAIVKVCSQSSFASINWIFSGVYGRPQFELRSKLWQELRTLSPYFKGPWVIAGDFNDVVDQSEKFGGAPINQHRVQAFTSCMNDCQMLDLGFTGGRFTWVNMQSDGHIIRERLDRDCWGIEDNNTSQCLETMMKKAKLWSRTTFGKLFKRKKQILACLEGIHRFLSTKHSSFLTSLEKDLANEYSEILKLEEDLWFMKSRTNGSLMAPGPDGVHPFFYQRFWQDIRSKLCSDIIGTFSSGAIPMGWNNCLISLIPKGKAPSSITQFRPIGLCNTSSKVISKILVNRLRPILDSLISPCQASFILGCRGSDNVIILQELVYSFSKKTGKVGDLIFKIDLEKAYDCLEWSFIWETLLFFQFPPKIIDLIMSAICTSSVSVLLNGDRTEPFSPSRGIRQGDPLSPYIFILCMEFLALTITKASSLGYWKGCKAGRGGPLLSHLFFADDLLFIGKATKNNCLFLKSILEFFSNRSGLKINPLKSYYLGIPISSKRPCKQDYVFILDKVRAKLEGWKSTMLSSSILSELDKISRDFLWGSNPDHRKLHLISWDKGIKWIMMDGNSVSLWKDCWLFDAPLNSILVGPLSRSDEDLRVADVFSCVDFNSSLISYPLPDTILETIKANPISKIGLGNDLYSWKGSRDGSFSMKVAYLMAKGVNPNPIMDWKWTWKIHTLPKIQCFIWLLCYERLKTLDLLSRLGIVDSNVCPMCLEAKETCDHLCRECPSSSFIWHTFFPQGTVGSSNSLFQWIKDNYLSKNMCRTIPIPWGTVFSFILWTSPLPSPKNTQKESRLVCWEKPPEGYCKLNTDGSAHGNPGPTSAGGVIRDHLGRWIVGFACKIGYASCLRAELWGIREGLLLAYQRNIQNLIVEVDSLVAT
ncbi:hypothetical protein SLEP1_g2381 [Rubroshorea leprosula]|uniref:Reverse transcriptase domain-containing protein n=1 Tax=Rubroshorea leprosula TaxID=152421 RepID=A0AAV5HLD5_9ROSI|nr:hypothetical protein SLEP1_g2381 [Rubroshorea leprosula]